MDIIVGKFSFNVKSLKGISKTKAIATFVNFDKLIIEKAWSEANPKRIKKNLKNK